jgi:hypothetical protein
VSNFAPYFRLFQDHRRPWRRPVIALAAAGCAVVAAGCGSSAGGGTSGSAGSAGTARSSAAAQAPQQVIAAASARSATVTSAAATLTEQGAGGQENISGTIVERIRPSLLMSMHLNVSSGGSSEAIGGVLNARALWLKLAPIQQETGKPWVKIPLSVLGKSGSATAGIFKSLQNLNPAQQTAWLDGARNVRKVGTATVDGVATTEYSGSIVPAQAVAKMAPALRKSLAAGLKSISGNIQFSVWIDGRGYVRKQVTAETANGQRVTTSILFTAINQPVHVTLPSAAQTATLPSSALGGTAAS